MDVYIVQKWDEIIWLILFSQWRVILNQCATFENKIQYFCNIKFFLSFSDKMPSPKSSSDLIFSKFSYGRMFETHSPLTKPPSALPDGLRLITATMGTGIHYAIFCSQKVIIKGTRFGPYTGRLVKPGDVNIGEDNPQMWEVSFDIAQVCSLLFPVSCVARERTAHQTQLIHT